jgi:D-glycero-beta-D-manno-heptose-7-phosphate kinase
MTDFAAFSNVSVLTVGDVMLDEYVLGQVERISPEAPVPIVEVQQRTYVAGGAGNAAAGVAALGARSLLCGVVGDDAAAAETRHALHEHGVEATGLVVDTARPTTTKTRVVAHSQQIVRTDIEDRTPLSAEIESRLREQVVKCMGGADALLVSDYAKGVVSETVARAAIDAARERGKPVVVDPKGVDYTWFAGATVVTPNVHDAGRAVRIHVRTDGDLQRAVEHLRAQAEGASLLVTRGAAGMRLFADSTPVDIEAEALDVFDVTGAGDTVVAVLAVALAAGMDLLDAVKLSNTAASIAVAKVGTAPVTLRELERRLAQSGRRSPET